MDLVRLTAKEIKGLCRHAILVNSKNTLHFRDSVIYCRLKHPVKVGEYYTDGGLCLGVTSFSTGHRGYDININEEDIQKCPDKE
jgi:hypothetical protein